MIIGSFWFHISHVNLIISNKKRFNRFWLIFVFKSFQVREGHIFENIRLPSRFWVTVSQSNYIKNDSKHFVKILYCIISGHLKTIGLRHVLEKNRLVSNICITVGQSNCNKKCSNDSDKILSKFCFWTLENFGARLHVYKKLK